MATMATPATAMGDDGLSVRVAVRVRPLIGREKVERCDECVSVVEDERQIIMGKNRAFTYDYVFSKYAQQGDLWPCVEPLVQATFEGYNATIFAYGQTGSGKTFTMGSGSSLHLAPEDFGIIPRVIGFMFDQVTARAAERPQYRAELRVRFLEVYGEEIRDLLGQLVSDTDARVALRETENAEVQVVGATEELVDDADQCLRLLERGTLCRTTGSTLMNAHSSRSHAIFTVSMVQYIPLDGMDVGDGELREDQFETRNSYFNFVDLAGSERQKRTQAEGKRLKEGIDINKGLLALGNVISALGDDKKRGRVHVPYRDSKLTRMLQDSLGGNSRTLMLCCVSPADVNFEETLNALKYANRARNIKNKPVVNRDEGSAMAVELRRQVQMLQAEVFRLRNPGLSESELKLATVGTNIIGMPMDFDTYGNLRSRAETAENEVARLMGEIKRNRTQLDHLKEEMIAAQAERDYLRLCVEESNANGTQPGELTAPAAREETANVLTEQLRTIANLQEKIREVEQERDRALMGAVDNSIHYGRTSTTRPGSSNPPPFMDADLKIDTELLERAEKDIERDAEMLKRLQGDAAVEDSGVDDQIDEQAIDSGECDDEEMDESTGSLNLNIELNEEDADRERVFQRRQRHLGDSVQDLAHDISLKEQLVANIRQAQENYDRLKNFYEQKMAQMVEEVRAAQLDRDRLIEEIQQIESKIRNGGDSGAGSGRLAKLSSELKDKEAELVSLKKKQNDINRFMNQKKKNEMQLRVLTAEISSMKRQKVELIKRMQDERKRYEEEANRRQREILSLKKSQQRDKQRIQQLGSQKEAQERVLKRKMEEINAAKARLKQQQQVQAQARRSATSYGRGRMASSRGGDTKWLSEEVRRRAEEQQKLEQLQTERKSVMKEMEALYAQRDKIEAELRKSISSQSNIRDVLISPLKAPPLTRRHSGAGSPERQLTPEEEQLLFDLEERIEACQAQLEYKEEKISEISESGTALVKIDNTQSLPEARTLLKMLFGMAVEVRKQDQQKEQEIAKMQVEVSDMARLLEQERDRAQQLKHNYEESLQKVMGSDPSESTHQAVATPLNERTRILLSVSEERNAALREKCDELESSRDKLDRERQLLNQKLQSERQELAESRRRIHWLESQLAAFADPSHATTHSNQRSNSPTVLSSAPSSLLPPSSLGKPGGPVSWANEFDDDDDDDDDMTGSVDDGRENLNADSRAPRSHEGALRDRRDFRVQLDDMGDNLDSISLSEMETRQDSIDCDENDDSPSIRSDDSSATPATGNSIFSRLSNPSNFTGIHKNRAKESVSKREVLQSRSDRNRSRRLKDRSIVKPPRAATPTERTSTNRFGMKTNTKRSSPVMEVLENMKLQAAETDARPPSPGPRSQSAETRRGAQSDDGGMPPPAPYSDVYSRLAAQYTASAQSKRHRSAPPTRRGTSKHDESSKASADEAEPLHLAAHDSLSQDESNGHDDLEEMSDDPLLGGSNLLACVHDDYRERLNNRNSSTSKLPPTSSSRY